VAEAVIRHVSTLGERWLVRASWTYAGIVLLVLALIQWRSDYWWPATLLLFMPRGVFLLPIVLLAAWAGWTPKKKMWALHGATALVVLVPLMGLSLPFGQLTTFNLPGTRVKMMTFNVGHEGISTYKLISLVERDKVQILCFQEGYNGHEGKLDPVLEAYLTAKNGWYRSREKTIASRLPIVEELPALDNPEEEESFWRARVERVRVRPPSGADFIVASVHMPTMYYAFSGLMAGDIRGMTQHIRWRAEKMGLVAAILSETEDLPLLLGSDMNMPSDSTLMSALRVPGLRYGFDAAGWGFGYTRPSSFPWVRIDHVMATPEFTFTRCWVGPDLGSDHLPLLAEVIIPKSTASTHPPADDKTENSPAPDATPQ
jgi:vancomycin resistance protein VanJ